MSFIKLLTGSGLNREFLSRFKDGINNTVGIRRDGTVSAPEPTWAGALPCRNYSLNLSIAMRLT